VTHNRYIAFDVETTGLFPQRGARIIEIGAVAIADRIITEEFHSLVRSDRPIPTQARHIHGITNAMLAGQPTPEEAMSEFRKFIGDDPLIAHNAPFDMAFVRRELQRQGLPFNNPSLCTLEMSQQRLPHLPNHKLRTVYTHLFGAVPPDSQPHRALGDARMVAMIWLAMEGK